MQRLGRSKNHTESLPKDLKLMWFMGTTHRFVPPGSEAVRRASSSGDQSKQSCSRRYIHEGPSRVICPFSQRIEYNANKTDGQKSVDSSALQHKNTETKSALSVTIIFHFVFSTYTFLSSIFATDIKTRSFPTVQRRNICVQGAVQIQHALTNQLERCPQ